MIIRPCAAAILLRVVPKPQTLESRGLRYMTSSRTSARKTAMTILKRGVLSMNAFNNVALSLVFLVGFELSGLAQASTITTYAGPGRVLPINGAPAMTQSIDAPSSVIPDTAGGFYFASLNQHRVYRVAADGRLTVIAGTGTAGFSGDGGPAFSAQLASPSDLVLDPAGNLFIAETNSHRIRRVSPVGIISTVAGGGTPGFSGDGGPATAAQLNHP